MAAALPPMLSKDELVEAHAKVEQLRVDMATRSAGGREASGRYKKHDTARKVYIDTVAMPSLRLGKRIDDDDWRRLFLPGDDEIAGADKADMDRWYKKHKHDPRSTLAASYQLDESKQITLLSWVQRNPSAYVRPESAPSGTPMSYRLTQRDVKAYAGFTLCQLAHDGNRRKLVPTARVPAGATLVWLASARFQWRFPEQVGLFLSLLALAKAGCTTTVAGNAIAVITAEAGLCFGGAMLKHV
mmetsp:Transcript_11723/g.37432  ORF Transcript_11723/g.37432 Transcript_11723/m.37432 type:complete len:243 (-) Transcript_11723:36-764(-)